MGCATPNVAKCTLCYMWVSNLQKVGVANSVHSRDQHLEVGQVPATCRGRQHATPLLQGRNSSALRVLLHLHKEIENRGARRQVQQAAELAVHKGGEGVVAEVGQVAAQAPDVGKGKQVSQDGVQLLLILGQVYAVLWCQQRLQRTHPNCAAKNGTNHDYRNRNTMVPRVVSTSALS